MTEQKSQAEQRVQQKQECTIIVSGMRKGGPNEHILENAASEHIYLYFDAIPSYAYSRTVEKSSYATENRCDLSDHAVIKDKQFTLTAYINTSPTYIRKNNKLDESTDPNNPAASMRPQKAMELLERLVVERQVISLATEEMGLLENMIITKLTAKRDVSEGAALIFDIELTQFRTFELNRVVNANIYSDPKKTGTKNKGAVQSSSNNAADSDKFKNENTVTVEKGEYYTRTTTSDKITWTKNSTGEIVGEEELKKKGGVVTNKGYKPNVSLNRK